MAVVSTDKSTLQTLEVFDIFFTIKWKKFGILDKWSLMGGGSLREMVELGGSTVFRLFLLIFRHYFSVLPGSSFFVLFVMKNGRVTFKGKTSPGERSIKGRGRGRREKSERA